MYTKKDINEKILTNTGSMNLIFQIWGNINTGISEDEKESDSEWSVRADQYQPRRNRVWSGEFSDKESFIENVKETIERMKIGQQLLQDWLDGKIDTVYYWDFEKMSE